MKAKEKHKILIDLSARAAIAALERLEEKSPGKTMCKPDLFASISRRVGWMMEDSDDSIYDEEAIAPPDKRFLNRFWKDIKPQAANKYEKYII